MPSDLVMACSGSEYINQQTHSYQIGGFCYSLFSGDAIKEAFRGPRYLNTITAQHVEPPMCQCGMCMKTEAARLLKLQLRNCLPTSDLVSDDCSSPKGVQNAVNFSRPSQRLTSSDLFPTHGERACCELVNTAASQKIVASTHLDGIIINQCHITSLPRNEETDLIRKLQQKVQVGRWNRRTIPVRGGEMVFPVQPTVRRLESSVVFCAAINSSEAIEKCRFAGRLYTTNGRQPLQDVQRSVGLPFRLGLKAFPQNTLHLFSLHFQGISRLNIKAVGVLKERDRELDYIVLSNSSRREHSPSSSSQYGLLPGHPSQESTDVL